MRTSGLRRKPYHSGRQGTDPLHMRSGHHAGKKRFFDVALIASQWDWRPRSAPETLVCGLHPHQRGKSRFHGVEKSRIRHLHPDAYGTAAVERPQETRGSGVGAEGRLREGSA